MLRLPLVSIVCCIFACGCVTVPLQSPRNNISLGAIVDDRRYSLDDKSALLTVKGRKLDVVDSDQNEIIKIDAAQRTPYYKNPLVWIGMAVVVGAVVATEPGADSQ